MSDQKSFLRYIHLFRGFAILVIVGIHCRIGWTWGENVQSKQIFTTLLDNGTVLFIFIAGFLFQHLKDKYEYLSYLRRKLKFVILPYLIVSILPIADKIVNESNAVWFPEFTQDNIFLQVIYMVLTGKQFGPFWFIPMISIFYLISPILLKLDHRVFYKFVLPILFVSGLWTFRFGYFSNTLDSFLHFFPAYMFGMAASYFKDDLLKINLSFYIVLAVVYLVIATLEIKEILPVNKLSSFQDAQDDIYFGFNFPKLRACILSLILLKFFSLYQHKKFSILNALGEYSFGIYFLHIYFIIILTALLQKIYPEFHLNVFYYLSSVIIVATLSIFSSVVARKIFGKKSRYIIGS